MNCFRLRSGFILADSTEEEFRGGRGGKRRGGNRHGIIGMGPKYDSGHRGLRGLIKKRGKGRWINSRRLYHRPGQHTLSFEQMQLLQQLPIFNEKLFSKTEFLGHSIADLLGFLTYMREAAIVMVKDKNRKSPLDLQRKFWDLVSSYLGVGPPADELKEIWEKLVKKLPEPTLRDSVFRSKLYICKSLRLNAMEVSSPGWPKKFPSFFDILEEAASSVLGYDVLIAGRTLKAITTPGSISIVANKCYQNEMRFYRQVIKHLRKPRKVLRLHTRVVKEDCE